MPNLILAAIILAALAGGVFLVDRNGYNRCEMDYLNAAAEFDDETDRAVEDVRQESETLIEEVYHAAPSDNGPVAPVLERVLDGLQERHGDTAR